MEKYMKSLKSYITEAHQEFSFRIKLAKEVSEEDIARMERHLVKYDITGMSTPKKLMLQSTPYDFPQLRGYEIYVIDFTTNLRASAYQIQTELQNLIGINDGFMKVRAAHEPLEQQEQAAIDGADTETTSILADPDYKDAPEINHEDYYGDKYNASFLDTLAKLKTEKEKAKR